MSYASREIHTITVLLQFSLVIELQMWERDRGSQQMKLIDVSE